MNTQFEQFHKELIELIKKHDGAQAVCVVSFKSEKLYINRWSHNNEPHPYFEMLEQVSLQTAQTNGGVLLFNSRHS